MARAWRNCSHLIDILNPVFLIAAVRPSDLGDDLRRHGQGVCHDRQAGPTPNEVGRKLPSTAKMLGISIHPAVRVEDCVGGIVAETKRAALMGHVLVGRICRETQYTAPDLLRILTMCGFRCLAERRRTCRTGA